MESRLVPYLRDDAETAAAALPTGRGDHPTRQYSFHSSSPINSNSNIWPRWCECLEHSVIRHPMGSRAPTERGAATETEGITSDHHPAPRRRNGWTKKRSPPLQETETRHRCPSCQRAAQRRRPGCQRPAPASVIWTLTARETVQIALKWAGFYNASNWDGAVRARHARVPMAGLRKQATAMKRTACWHVAAGRI